MNKSSENIASRFQNVDGLLLQESQPYTGAIESSVDGELVVSNYVNGKLHGIQKEYYSTGELKRASIFTNGLENGRRVEYYPCGSKRLNANFLNGQEDGVVEEWETNGKIKSRKTYFSGKLIAVKANL